ncbi:MAG: hypothetical protein WCK42_09255, partial [Myxococcaceae bacterium]
MIQSSLGYAANNYDYIYRNNPTDLYDAQSEQAFLANKQQAYGQTVLSALPVFALLGGSYATYRFFSGAPESGEKTFFGSTRFFFLTFMSTTLGSIFTSILTPYAGAIQEPISGFFNSCWGYVFGPPNDDLQKLELQYIRTKANLTEKNKKALESNFAKLRQKFSPQSFHGSSNNKEELELTLVKRILQLPIESKILEFNQTLFETEFSGYRGMSSTEPIFELERFARSLVIASKHKNP